jgi:hypothetical protein
VPSLHPPMEESPPRPRCALQWRRAGRARDATSHGGDPAVPSLRPAMEETPLRPRCASHGGEPAAPSLRLPWRGARRGRSPHPPMEEGSPRSFQIGGSAAVVVAGRASAEETVEVGWGKNVLVGFLGHIDQTTVAPRLCFVSA